MMNSVPQASAVKGVREDWRPLLELAVREVFDIVLGAKLESADGLELRSAALTAMVGLAGQLCGVLSVRCSLKSAALVTSKMLGVEVNDGDDQMCDAVGELCNVVAGNFKTKLGGIGDGCMLSVPTVITGEDYRTHSLADAGSLDLAFSFEDEIVIVSLEVHS